MRAIATRSAFILSVVGTMRHDADLYSNNRVQTHAMEMFNSSRPTVRIGSLLRYLDIILTYNTFINIHTSANASIKLKRFCYSLLRPSEGNARL